MKSNIVAGAGAGVSAETAGVGPGAGIGTEKRGGNRVKVVTQKNVRLLGLAKCDNGPAFQSEK